MTTTSLPRGILQWIHFKLAWAFIIIFLFHVYVTTKISAFNWGGTVKTIRLDPSNILLWAKLIQRASAWYLLVIGLLVFLSGLEWLGYNLPSIIPFYRHYDVDTYFLLGFIIHILSSIKIALVRRNLVYRGTDPVLILTGTILFSLLAYQAILAPNESPPTVPPTTIHSIEGGNPTTQNISLPEKLTTTLQRVEVNESMKTSTTTFPFQTEPENEGTVKIGKTRYSFKPKNVKTNRPDLFNDGYFSVFDVLAHLARQGHISIDYHFEESMNTYTMDSINGEPNWWYEIYYSAGWPERTVFRPDHYPWKDGTTLTFFKESESRLKDIRSVWRDETARKKANQGNVIIPEVIIYGKTINKRFKNIEVTPHNIRSDVFKQDTVTAVDVIMSLGDEELISYKLNWYESIGRARVVKDYWVDKINGDSAAGRCGFVYEAGSKRYSGFRGNHIHLPSDTRPLNSPEYVEFFWICI